MLLIDLILIRWENIKLKRVQVHQRSKTTLGLCDLVFSTIPVRFFTSNLLLLCSAHQMQPFVSEVV